MTSPNLPEKKRVRVTKKTELKSATSLEGKDVPSATPPRNTTRSKVSMADVAQLAGCSQSTVSIVLNNTPGIKIGDATRQRVHGAVEELNYTIPRRRASGPTVSAPVGFVLDQLGTSFEAIQSVVGAREALMPSGRVLLVAETLDDEEMERRVLETLLSQGVTALIYATNHTRKVELPKMLQQVEVPVVLLNCYTDTYEFPAVVPSEIAAGIRGTDHLLKAGHQRIAMITGELWMEGAAGRLAGYRQSLATADIQFDSELVRLGNWQVDSGYNHTKALMKIDNPPTAIFCSSDRMAVGAIEALKELGLKIPQDVSVLGFDNEDISRHITPAITTIELPQAEMGRWAVDNILSGGGPKSGLNPKIKLECQLIERDSVGPLKTA
jgi:LacI family transcriptional regulator